MIIGKTGIFIRQEHTVKSGVINHHYAGTILDKFRSHEKIQTEFNGIQYVPVDYYLVELQGVKLDGMVTRFFPDEMISIQDHVIVGTEREKVSQKLIKR